MIEPVHPAEPFEKDIRELQKIYPRIDEVRKAVMWELTRNPTAGEEIYSRPGYWLLITYPIGSMPPFKVLYKFSPHNPYTVVLLRIVSGSSKEFEQ